MSDLKHHLNRLHILILASHEKSEEGVAMIDELHKIVNLISKLTDKEEAWMRKQKQ